MTDAPAPISSPAAPLLRIRGLGMRYGSQTVLEALDLDVADGEFLTILGPSGSGKTTLLRLIAGLVRPTHGRIELDGQDIAPLPIEKRPFNTVFQDYALFPHMTVAANVGFGLRIRGIDRATIAGRVRQALAEVEMERFAARFPAALSGGQRQRVALARALICGPRLVLLDEPLSALDATLRRQMQDFLKDLQRRTGVTFIFVTHDQAEAITLSDRICVMAGGRIEQLGDPRSLYYRPTTAFVAGFFGDNNVVSAVRVISADADGIVVEAPIGRLRVSGGAAPVVPGQTALLAVRPEALRPAAAGAVNAFGATVREVAFVGSETTVRLEARGTSLTVKLRSDRGKPAPAPGSAVTLAFDPSDGWLLPEAAP